jgi:NADH-quinone oxidoreductase subunit M
MITVFILFFPLLASVALLFTKNEYAKKIALAISFIELVATAIAAFSFVPGPNVQLSVNYEWISTLGINFYTGMDGISLLMVLLTSFLVPIIILSSFSKEYSNAKAFYFLILLMETGLQGVFVSQNTFLFYIFWELALVPIYFISAIWGGEKRIQVTLKFFIYTILGSLFMLLAFIYLYLQAGGYSMDYQALYNIALDKDTQTYIFWALFLAFAIKMPIFPFHTWQPDTYTEAPTPGSMLLSGIMLKMGIYGILRFIIPMLPVALEDWGSTAIILSVTGIVYASLIAMVQKDMKRLIAYSSIAHVGLISAGVLSLNAQGLTGGIIQMLSHGLCVVGLFFVVDLIKKRTGSRMLDELGGIAEKSPVLAIYFMIIMLGSIALPLTSGFIGEYLMLTGLYIYNPYLAAIAGLGIIFGAVYMLNMYKKSMYGVSPMQSREFTPLSLAENTALFALSAGILWIGIYPETFLQIARPAADHLLEMAKH